ncbi:MAG: hypothetical protein AABX47_02145 [Nanoarchaeota archaeon]
MSEDLSRPPYVLVDRMINFATPHDGECILNLGAGSGMTDLLRKMYPKSTILDDGRNWNELRDELAHSFHRVVLYSQGVTHDLLREASRFVPPRGTLVAGFPISKPWYRRESGVAKRIFDEFHEQDWCAHGVSVVSDESGHYGVARFYPYIPESGMPSRKAQDLLAMASLMHDYSSDEVREALAMALIEFNNHGQRESRKLEESLR